MKLKKLLKRPFSDQWGKTTGSKHLITKHSESWITKYSGSCGHEHDLYLPTIILLNSRRLNNYQTIIWLESNVCIPRKQLGKDNQFSIYFIELIESNLANITKDISFVIDQHYLISQDLKISLLVFLPQGNILFNFTMNLAKVSKFLTNSHLQTKLHVISDDLRISLETYSTKSIVYLTSSIITVKIISNRKSKGSIELCTYNSTFY